MFLIRNREICNNIGLDQQFILKYEIAWPFCVCVYIVKLLQVQNAYLVIDQSLLWGARDTEVKEILPRIVWK